MDVHLGRMIFFFLAYKESNLIVVFGLHNHRMKSKLECHILANPFRPHDYFLG